MPTPKILQLVKSCRECPRRRGATCEAVDALIADIDEVAPFCPLADYPSEVISSQETTILLLRDSRQWGMSVAVLAYVAMKLKLNMNAGHQISVTIPYKRGDQECLAHVACDCIVRIDILSLAIVFVDGDDTFKLYADGSPPTMSLESKDHPGLWEQLNLVI